MNACAANTTRPSRSLGRLSMKSFKIERAMSKRSTRLPFTTKSSDLMLPDKSNATTMSTPLAFTVVVLFDKRGCASAKIKMASVSQRNAARKFPARECRARVKPSTSFSDEYKNAGGEPRLPFSHAKKGSRKSKSRKYGWAKAIFDLRFLIYDFWRRFVSVFGFCFTRLGFFNEFYRC